MKLETLGNQQVQNILNDLGMIDENGCCPYTAEEIFKSGIEWYISQQNTTDYVEESVSWFKNNWREYINVDADGIVVFGHWENDFREYMDSKNKGNYIP